MNTTNAPRAVVTRLDPREAKPGRKPKIVCLADVKPERVSWLWKPYLPLGKLCLLEGDPAAGKTFISLAVAAAVSRGYTLGAADGQPHEPVTPGNVVLMTCEDGLADTIRPRLDSLGAEPRNVFALEGWNVTRNGKEAAAGLVTLKDVELLEETLAEHRPLLLIVDPVVGFMGDADANKATEVRPLLHGLSQLAEKHGTCVLLLRHLTKGATSRAHYRGQGSVDFLAAARSVLLAGRDPVSGESAVAHLKSSCAPRGTSLGYKLDADGFQWTGASSLTGEDLVAADESNGKRSSLEDAVAFLREELAGGPQPTKVVEAAAREQKIAARTLDRARQTLGVVSARSALPGQATGAPRGPWTLSLPGTPT